MSFLDALFMATSAVCVTGLAVHTVATEYTSTGQVVLLGLVQTDGLGIMVLSASMVIQTGRKLRARSSAVLAKVLHAESVAALRGNIRSIVLLTPGGKGGWPLRVAMASAQTIMALIVLGGLGFQ